MTRLEEGATVLGLIVGIGLLVVCLLTQPYLVLVVGGALAILTAAAYGIGTLLDLRRRR